MVYGACPYFLYDKKDLLFCENSTMKFPDKISRNEFLKCHCCSEEHGFEECSNYKMLTEYYERLYNNQKVEKFESIVEPKTNKRGRKPKIDGGF